MTSQCLLAHRFLLTICSATLLLSIESALGQQSIPVELQAQSSGLNDEQIEFITSGEILKYIPERQLEHELATRDATSLRSMMDDLMSIANKMIYAPERDMGAAPLNLTTKRFGMPMPTPALLRDFEREPGPFTVHRYLFPKTGVPTFAAVAIWPEDLVAGNVDVAIVGVPSNASSGRRDARNGPNEMRALNTIGMADVQSLLKPFETLSVVDYGNFSVDRMSTERTAHHVATMVAETAGTGATPMLVGGDTSLLYAGVSGVAQAHGTGSFGLLHFSAHPDTERNGAHTISDRQALFLLLDKGIVKGADTVQVGLRGPTVDVDTLQWLRDQSVRYHTMAEFWQRGSATVMQRVLQEVDSGPDAYFVSIDVSVINPAEMLAAGRATPNGLALEEVTQAIRHVCAIKEIVGFEITDVAPMMDPSRLSIMHANATLNACLVGIAVRKAGLGPDYVHPLALDHGQR